MLRVLVVIELARVWICEVWLAMLVASELMFVTSGSRRAKAAVMAADEVPRAAIRRSAASEMSPT
jgi:hypothetical protein